MRLVFAGTPEPAVPSLRALLASDHEVVAVVTRPDARAGRGRTLAASPVRQVAQEAGVEVLTPASARDPEFAARLVELAPDACPVVAYGGLIPAPVLEIPRHGWVNLHFSLLPAWRGAAPVQRALMAGDEMTGATTFLLEEGLDTGPVLGTLTEPIRPEDTAGTLLERLADVGAGLLVASLDGLADGSLRPVEQPGEGVSHAPKITVDDARIDWTRPAYAVGRQIRGCTPAPGAWTTFRGDRFKVAPLASVNTDGHDHASVDNSGDSGSLRPGELRVQRRAVLVGTGTGAVELGTVQAHGKKAMAATDWARGVRIETGEVLGG
ncbi:methionyl-tRNA formyltransferase [Ornithinimicrobium faecis]|uniref:Methionyl-tRNA formyltransferase n=1 Tax=Ornithinimicrobium faecis TaxID=2934158 RepID=A0ABY4YQ97_9MICO|nr:methionyl-tRNA formyltransferase [Ornithinimicrobium sp. HY1793]USQ78327.1 methionyl-tRNA formyltransferase [Ornithinimicrobium sp. HY1793]